MIDLFFRSSSWISISEQMEDSVSHADESTQKLYFGAKFDTLGLTAFLILSFGRKSDRGEGSGLKTFIFRGTNLLLRLGLLIFHVLFSKRMKFVGILEDFLAKASLSFSVLKERGFLCSDMCLNLLWGVYMTLFGFGVRSSILLFNHLCVLFHPAFLNQIRYVKRKFPCFSWWRTLLSMRLYNNTGKIVLAWSLPSFCLFWSMSDWGLKVSGDLCL